MKQGVNFLRGMNNALLALNSIVLVLCPLERVRKKKLSLAVGINVNADTSQGLVSLVKY